MSSTANSKVILITGGTNGLGRAAAKRFLEEGHTVIITGRNKQRIDDAIVWIKPSTITRERLHNLVLDLESLSSIRSAAESFQALGLQLDILINNAGCVLANREYVADTNKVEKTTFVSAVAPWYLTMLLAPHMQPGGRILFVTSALHSPEGAPINQENSEQIKDPNLFDLLDGTPNYNGIAYYKVSKLAMLWVGFVMAIQFPELSVLSFEPGFVPVTGLARQQTWFARMLFKFVLPYTSHAVTVDQAVSDYVYYATSKEYDGVTGEYLFKRAKTETSARARNMEEAIKFWNLSCDICNTPEHKLT